MAGLNSISPTQPHCTAYPPSLPLSPDADDAPPGPPNPGTACHSPRQDVDAEKSPHKKVVDRQSHTTNIPIIIIQMQSRVPVKNVNKRLYPAKITC